MGLWNKMRGVFGRIKNIVAKAGLPIGAAIGSIVPGVGTALGSTIGGALQGLARNI